MFSARGIQMLEYYDIGIIHAGYALDKRCSLYADVVVYAIGVSPQVFYTPGSMMLCSFYVIYLAL